MLEELKDLRKRNEELIYNDKECQINKAKLNQELITLRDQSSVLNAQNIKLKQESEAKNQQLQENSPNLDIAKNSIIQPAIKGKGKGGFFQKVQYVLQVSKSQKKIFQKTILNLKFKFPVNISKQQIQISSSGLFFGIFFFGNL